MHLKSITQQILLGVLAMCFFHNAAEAGDHSHPSGLELKYIDRSVRPQDDLYGFTSGKWLKEAVLPADRARFGSFDELRDKAELQVRAIIEELAASTNLVPGSEAQKIADLYSSFMDEAKIEALDDQPLKAEFTQIDSIHSKKELSALLGVFNLRGIHTPIGLGIEQDGKDSTRYLLHLSQDGIGLPDRDYFLKEDDAKLKSARMAYEAHIAQVFTMMGESHPEDQARDVIAFETALAQAQWTKVALRDPNKTYNKLSVSELNTLAPEFDWDHVLPASGIPMEKVKELIVATPTFFSETGKLMEKSSLETLKSYLKWQVARRLMPYLSKRFVDADFNFYSKTLRGIPENRPRWKRGVGMVEMALGEAVGKLYVERHFPPKAKERMDALVGNLMTAYRQSIQNLSWMSAETRTAAQLKLSKFNVKIGYTQKWRNYQGLTVVKGDVVGNATRAAIFESERQIARLGQAVERDEWLMTPQTVNAYYNPAMNEIVFPAAILQPPFFNFEADDAVNYGGIGAVIGHEISHGFDDQGSQYDGDGNLRDWWSQEDHAQFDQRTNRLVAQYERYEPVKGYHVNGKLTLGENIADNSGLAIAYKAYQLSLVGKPAAVIEEMTGEQRFYMGWAQVWRGKARESEAIRLIKVDPHSPAEVRGNAPLVNQPGFYGAFGVQSGDKLYLPEAERVTIW